MNQTDNVNTPNDGFTIIELLIAMAITGIVMGAVYSAYLSQSRSYIIQDQVTEMQQNLRAAMHVMVGEIRMAAYDPTGDSGAAIIAAGDGSNGNPFSFSLVADDDDEDNDNDGTTDEAGELKTIRYDLYDAYSDGDTDIGRRDKPDADRRALAENIDTLNFVYLDEGRNTTLNLGDIRSVQITIIARSENEDKDQKHTDNRIYANLQGTTILDKSASPDHYRRRILRTEVRCRNMGLN